VIAIVPVTPSLAALIVAEPAATPVTNPLPLTVAIDALLDAHVIVPVTMLPLASFKVAVTCCVAPTAMLALVGLSVIEATEPVGGAAVVPLATFDKPPNTAFTFKVPRNATSWN